MAIQAGRTFKPLMRDPRAFLLRIPQNLTGVRQEEGIGLWP